MVATPSALKRAGRIGTLSRAQVDDLAEIFKVLSDPTRLRILAVLVQDGPLCVHQLCARVAMSQPAVSHQLRTLRAARLVRGQRLGREIEYRLDDDHVVRLILEGLHHVEHGGPA